MESKVFVVVVHIGFETAGIEKSLPLETVSKLPTYQKDLEWYPATHTHMHTTEELSDSDSGINFFVHRTAGEEPDAGRRLWPVGAVAELQPGRR